jgi:hypothetical protein
VDVVLARLHHGLLHFGQALRAGDDGEGAFAVDEADADGLEDIGADLERAAFEGRRGGGGEGRAAAAMRRR